MKKCLKENYLIQKLSITDDTFLKKISGVMWKPLYIKKISRCSYSTTCTNNQVFEMGRTVNYWCHRMVIWW